VGQETAADGGRSADDGGVAGGGGPASGGGGDASGAPAQREHTPTSEDSSAVGEVLAQATGTTSDGGTGLLLPLAIVAAIAWAIAYLLRQRSRQTV
jgi:hypothetical protein